MPPFAMSPHRGTIAERLPRYIWRKEVRNQLPNNSLPTRSRATSFCATGPDGNSKRVKRHGTGLATAVATGGADRIGGGDTDGEDTAWARETRPSVYGVDYPSEAQYRSRGGHLCAGRQDARRARESARRPSKRFRAGGMSERRLRRSTQSVKRYSGGGLGKASEIISLKDSRDHQRSLLSLSTMYEMAGDKEAETVGIAIQDVIFKEISLMATYRTVTH
ncbi:hypothetical protein B0H14DRAFT_2632914 [Mycena olivaceomarginata]|nr:hypothetical protein B0H14DRAFT_2632914 [Mycena olivaceomarginata]